MGAGALGRLGPALDHEDGELDVGKMSRSDLLRYAEKNGATAPVVDVLRVRADLDGSVALHMAPAQLDPRMSARERVQVVGALSRLLRPEPPCVRDGGPPPPLVRRGPN